MAANNAQFKTLSEHRCFGGVQRFHEHTSSVIGLPMRFSVFLPPQAEASPVPAVIYLAGLTCNEETFMVKAGAQRVAAALGMALIAPDTSPRGANIEGDSASWDFGVGAGFYLDATESPWAAHWRMESYLVNELLPLIVEALPVDAQRIGVFGHSMGGHGALTLALRHLGCSSRCRHWRRSAHRPLAPGARRHSPGTSALIGRFGRRTTRVL